WTGASGGRHRGCIWIARGFSTRADRQGSSVGRSTGARGGIMKKLLGLGTAVALVLGAGVADAKPLNWSGSMTSNNGNLPPVTVTGRRVGALNCSART